MNKIYSSLIFLLIAFCSTGQPINILKDSAQVQIDNYAVLADRGYSVSQIVSDSTLSFVPDDSIHPQREDVYWIKVVIDNPFQYAGDYSVLLFPQLENTLYYFDYNVKKWVAQEAGLVNKRFKKGPIGLTRMPLILQARARNTFYIRTDVTTLREFGYSLKPVIKIKKQSASDHREKILWVGWMAAITVLFLFFLNNLYIYFSFKDKTVLYYLVAQLGGMLYITTYRGLFTVFFPNHVFTIWQHNSNSFDYYDSSSLIEHVAILLVMFGYMQFTRSFLNTPKTLPKLDIIDKYGLRIYVGITLCIMLINCTIFCIAAFSIRYENMIALLLILLMLYTCIAGYRGKLRAAGPFLLANVMPLIFMMGTTVFHVFVTTYNTDDSFMPELATVAQSFGFSIALVARTRLIQNDLKIKEIEARQLEFDVRELTLTQRLIELENEKINAEILEEKARNELLSYNLETNNRELASTTLYMVQKNKMLADLKKQLQDSSQLFPNSKNQELKGIESILNSNLYLDSDWAKFKLHFEQVHPRFFEELYEKHPSLTKNEIRLFAYFHMKLSTKEIASLLNIDPASVRRAKTRLYKKMSLSEEA